MYELISNFLGEFPNEFSFIFPIAFLLILILVIYTLFFYPFEERRQFMKKSLLFFGLFLFSIFLVPSGVFADSVKVQYSDYSLNFSEEEKQKAIDSILSDSNLNNFSKDSYFFTILYTASYSDVTINSTDDELQKRSKYILLVSPKTWNNGRPLIINSYSRFDINASNAYYFDDDFVNLGEHTGSIYHS